jgi:hypothetical protein
MEFKNLILSYLWKRVLGVKGNPLVRLYRLCYGMKLDGFRVCLIPGIIACNISFRAGGSGRIYHSYL